MFYKVATTTKIMSNLALFEGWGYFMANVLLNGHISCQHLYTPSMGEHHESERREEERKGGWTNAKQRLRYLTASRLPNSVVAILLKHPLRIVYIFQFPISAF